MTRPKEIYWFTFIQLISLAFGLYFALNNWDGLVADANPTGQISEGMTNNIVIFTLFSGFGLPLILVTLIWLRNNIARWIYVIVGAIGTVMGGRGLVGATFDSIALIAAVQLLVSLLLIGILFMPNVTRWFARKNDGSAFS